VKKLQKARKLAPPRVLPPSVHQAQLRMSKKIAAFLTKTSKDLAAKVKQHQSKVAKAESDDWTDKLLEGIDWEPLAHELEPDLVEVASESSESALGQVGVTDSGLISSANTVAGKWAKDRAAEMVGMRYGADGELVPNPNANWAISETTRDDIKSLVEDAFSRDTPIGELADSIQESGTFSDYRAEMIARTEVAKAQGQGNLLGWNTSGVVSGVEWLLSADHEDAYNCNCSDNADEGPFALNDVPEFPDHPNCWCALAPVLISQDQL
jgi:hypothetical protein